MADLTSNQKLRPIIDDGEGDVALWNKVNSFSYQFRRSSTSERSFFFRSNSQEIAKYFRGKGVLLQNSWLCTVRCSTCPRRFLDFMNAPWLFAEAYKYRRLRECFSISKHWKVDKPLDRTCDVILIDNISIVSSPGHDHFHSRTTMCFSARSVTLLHVRKTPSSSFRRALPYRGCNQRTSLRRKKLLAGVPYSSSSPRYVSGVTRLICPF